MKTHKKAPVVLVNTWIKLARSFGDHKVDNAVSVRAMEMLRVNVGTPEEIKKYMKENGIK
jgi:hypothetical protein